MYRSIIYLLKKKIFIGFELNSINFLLIIVWDVGGGERVVM